MCSAAHFKEGEEPKEEAVFFKGRISRLSTAWTFIGLSREKKLNQSFAVEIVVQNRRLIFWLPGRSAVSGDTTPAVSGALLTYDPCAQLGIADEVLVSIVSASELVRPVQKYISEARF